MGRKPLYKRNPRKFKERVARMAPNKLAYIDQEAAINGLNLDTQITMKKKVVQQHVDLENKANQGRIPAEFNKKTTFNHEKKANKKHRNKKYKNKVN